MMSRFLNSILILAAMCTVAAAQQRPLSPPARPPVPLSDADQERIKREQAERNKPGAEGDSARESAPRISIPVAGARRISSGDPAIDAIVHEAAGAYGLDPNLILAVMRAESGFRRGAISPKGASGLMQLMPATAARFGVRNIFDPRENILAGARYLRWLLDRFGGDVVLALAGYNAGEGAVEHYGNRVPPFHETQNYVRTIYAHYSRLYQGSLPSVAAVESAMPVETTAAGSERIPTYNQIIRSTSSSGESANNPQQ